MDRIHDDGSSHMAHFPDGPMAPISEVTRLAGPMAPSSEELLLVGPMAPLSEDTHQLAQASFTTTVGPMGPTTVGSEEDGPMALQRSPPAGPGEAAPTTLQLEDDDEDRLARRPRHHRRGRCL